MGEKNDENCTAKRFSKYGDNGKYFDRITRVLKILTSGAVF